MKYNIDLISRRSVEIEANAPKEAIKLAENRHRGHKADFITDNENLSTGVARCEGCLAIIFDEEYFNCDDQGNSFCVECTEAARSDWQNTLKEYEQIVGRELKKAEKKLVELFYCDIDYEFYKDGNGNLGARLKSITNEPA